VLNDPSNAPSSFNAKAIPTIAAHWAQCPHAWALPFTAAKWLGTGYILHKANNIPGFYTDIDTEKDGPKVMILAELDALAVLFPIHYTQFQDVTK